MAKRIRIKEVLDQDFIGKKITVKGWVRTFRSNRFVALSDGSVLNTLQIVVDFEAMDEALLKRITTGAAISATGEIVESQGRGQTVEMIADTIEILGDSDAEKYPLQPKRHSMEFLREIAHLRFRTNTFGAIFRIRHALAYGIHKFFNDKGFVYIHSPLITGSDAEGAGEMFQVTTMDMANPPRTEDGDIDFKQDFFKKATNLTVSGQLEAELGALALGDVYTFGHLAEFWMIEPEMAFADLTDNMDTCEEMLKFLIKYVLDNCRADLEFLDQRRQNEEKSKPQAERSPMGLIEQMQFCLDNEFERVTYTEAINILRNSKPNKKKRFEFVIEDWGADLQSEHERYLVEKHFKKPVILVDYPKEIKSFYMRQNDDGKTVASQREERLDKLTQRMDEMDIPQEEMEWFLDTRRFGTCKHAGYGLGFERMMLFVTGMTNIRDVIPFPRFPGSAEF